MLTSLASMDINVAYMDDKIWLYVDIYFLKVDDIIG